MTDSAACDHLVWFKEVDEWEVGKRHYPCTVSDLAEGIWSRLDAEETAELEPNPDEHIFTFCPNCGARIDWDAIRARAKAYLEEAKRAEETKARDRNEQHMAEVRKLREASFGSFDPHQEYEDDMK